MSSLGKLGRPSMFTKERRKKIIEYLQAGNYRETAAVASGISYATLRDWEKQGEEAEEENDFSIFSRAIKEAEADGERQALERIQKQAEEGVWTAAAWFLERKHNERWGRRDRTELTGKDGKDLIPNTRNRLRNLSGEELALLAHVLRGDETEEKAS